MICPRCQAAVAPDEASCPQCHGALLGSSDAAGPIPARTSSAELPARGAPRSGKQGLAIGALGVLLAFLLKGKGLLLLLLTKAKLLLGLFKLSSLWVVVKTGGSMLVMIGVYACSWPVSFAVGFTVLMLIHELGHALALRSIGLPFSAPIFIPFIGAFIGLKKMPADAAKEAFVGFAGPFTGTIAAQACLVLYDQGGGPIYLGMAQAGFMLNLFNLVPYSPLDGGRIVGAISPKIWVLALPAMLVAGLYYRSLILLLVAVTGVPRAISVWRGTEASSPYFQVRPRVRLLVAAAYLGLGGFLGGMMAHAAGLAAGAGH